MASRRELLDIIRPGMGLTNNFFLKVYGYDMTTPGFAEDVLTRLEGIGCSKARNYYTCITAEWQHGHDVMMKNVAAWYRKQDFDRKKVDEPRKQQEVEQQMKDSLQQKSDRELLTLLQNLK